MASSQIIILAIIATSIATFISRFMGALTSRKVSVKSKIFQWFAKDFKQNNSVIDFINQYSDIKISENAKIKFKDYNWALNE